MEFYEAPAGNYFTDRDHRVCWGIFHWSVIYQTAFDGVNIVSQNSRDTILNSSDIINPCATNEKHPDLIAPYLRL